MRKKIIVVGNGMVGYKFCEKLRSHPLSSSFEVTVFGEEPRPAYDRVHLSEYFEDENEDKLKMAPFGWYSDQNIALHVGELVTKLDTEAKRITTHTGLEYDYDYLVLATGSYPFVPPIQGVDKKGVFVYRTIEDLEGMISYAKSLSGSAKPRAAVLGGGLLGLEAGKAVMDMGLSPYVIEFASRLMPRQLDEAGAGILQSTLEGLGINILTSKSTSIIGGEDEISYLEFSDGKRLEVDMLVISAGIRPRDEIAKNAGIQIGPKGGVVVNDKMETSDKNIYAIGEVALYNQQIYGLVAPGYDMADIAVEQITGGEKTIKPTIDMSTKLKLIGVDVASFGDCFGTLESSKSIDYTDTLEGVYKRINISPDGKRLVGGMLVGDASDYNMLLQITQNGMAIPPNPEDLILGSRNGEESTMGSAMDLPDSAVVCSCESITKGDLCEAITEKGCDTIKLIAKENKACTGCGGCKPMVEDLLKAVLESQGKVVKEIICEHFEYSRQELYDLIKVKGIKDYDEALDKIGKGHGCETCKPALASVFAGIYNETPNRQATIQDTNDRFLANIQRNGTYSVVPRVPGGEITPEKLIAIGEVAKKYDLYTKITGGQRIDLFGAELNDLPLIWEELINAGFESGHAYGKALRTVKSCVGSTWCRYGMDESVSFAIELENRYKGLRSPHKFKGGVSGCIRECAEARCKDFGLIATEGGWNLYVCGNGGANPKHAQLLAENIDNETCITYLDRFIMFYIKTAPPLTRTAAWLEKLEGGIDYLKQVVIDDVLGINSELESDLNKLINAYKCEWKEAIETPEIRNRFKHFVNSDDKNEHITFEKMRDQKQPRPW